MKNKNKREKERKRGREREKVDTGVAETIQVRANLKG